MTSKHTAKFVLTALLALLAAGQAQAQARLQVFDQVVIGNSVSGDGRWAVMGDVDASGGSSVYLWSAADGSLTNIGGFAGTAGSIDISRDGSYITAQTQNENGVFVSSIYNRNKGSWSIVPDLGGNNNNAPYAVTGSVTWALSADGRYVGGSAYAPGSPAARGFLTDTLTGKVTTLSTDEARITAIAPGAATLFGYAFPTGTTNRAASMWTLNGDGSYAQKFITRPDFPSQLMNEGTAMSGNGLWATGLSFNTTLPYRVNVQTGAVQYFDKLPLANETGKSLAAPGAISADGNTIVGIHSPQGAALGASTAFIWKGDGSVNGFTLGGTVMSFDDYLAGYGIDLANHYDFLTIVGMDDSGTVFTGIARDNLSNTGVSFVVTVPVPEPSQYLLMLGGLVALGGVARRRAARRA